MRTDWILRSNSVGAFRIAVTLNETRWVKDRFFKYPETTDIFKTSLMLFLWTLISCLAWVCFWEKEKRKGREGEREKQVPSLELIAKGHSVNVLTFSVKSPSQFNEVRGSKFITVGLFHDKVAFVLPEHFKKGPLSPLLPQITDVCCFLQCSGILVTRAPFFSWDHPHVA